MMPRSLETRLGIVLYGGVSLAVYENGVAQELFRAARGEPKKTTVYDLVKAIADTEIVVDIVSGTSAGGVNGILLGYALARNADFRKSAELWREQGDLMSLLRKPDDEEANSVLDSRGYYQEALESAFRIMSEGGAYGAAYASELDLFVTGTDVHGRVFTELDDQGHAIDVKEHRTVFKLMYRPERKNDFADSRYPHLIEALAKLARITSCFPVAFEPVHVCDPDAGDGDDDEDTAADQWLKRWGQLTHDAYFLDGGILNNKPFTYTIDAIFGRLTECAVDRMLYYVEPSPEQFADRPLAGPPNVMEAATDALVGIPGYQSIAQDLQAIAQRNSRLEQYREILDCLGEPDPLDPWMAQPPEDPYAVLGDLRQPAMAGYLRARQMAIRDRAILGILKQNGALRLLNAGEKHAARMLVESFNEWPGDGTRTLDEFDIDYRMRRLYRCIYVLDRQPERMAAYLDTRRRLNHLIKMFEIVKYGMETVLDQAAIPWKDLKAQTEADWKAAEPKWRAVQNLMRELLDSTQVPGDAATRDWTGTAEGERNRAEREERRRLRQQLGERIERLEGQDGAEAAQISGNLLADLEAQERAVFARLERQDRVRLEYCRFLQVDSMLFPIEAMAGIVSKDKIRTVRISPIGDRFGLGAAKNKVGDKLCGRVLGNFGGFLKKSWRANDVMWGRLDALSQLLQCMVTPERIRELAERRYDFGVALGGFDLAAVFPGSEDAELRRLRADLATLPVLAAEHVAQAGRGEGRSRFEAFLDRLIRAAQTEIVEEELPRVIRCAIEQQVRWNRYAVRKPGGRVFDPDRQAWEVGVRQIDGAVLEVARDRLEDLKGNPERGFWTRFLETRYRVPAETLASGIPLPVALELAAHMALVLENCLPAVAGDDRAEAVRENAVFQWFVDYPVRALYRFAVFQRTAPEWARSAVLAGVVVSVVALAIGIVWHDPLICCSGGFALAPFALLIGAPVVVLLLLLGFRVLGIVLPAAGLLLAATTGSLGKWREGLGAISGAVRFLEGHGAAILVGAGAGLTASIVFNRAWRVTFQAYDKVQREEKKAGRERPQEPTLKRVKAAGAGK